MKLQQIEKVKPNRKSHPKSYEKIPNLIYMHMKENKYIVYADPGNTVQNFFKNIGKP